MVDAKDASKNGALEGEGPSRDVRAGGTSAARMREIMQSYLRAVSGGDVEAVLALMSDDVSVEDPVGGQEGTHVVGIEAVSDFFRAGFGRARPRPTPTGPVCTTGGHEAAMSFVLRLTLGTDDYEVDVVDVMTFDSAGKISRLRAFWNAKEMRRVV